MSDPRSLAGLKIWGGGGIFEGDLRVATRPRNFEGVALDAQHGLQLVVTETDATMVPCGCIKIEG